FQCLKKRFPGPLTCFSTNLTEMTARECNDGLPITPSKQASSLQIGRVPRLMSPGVESSFVIPKPIINSFDWDASDSCMPVLERMIWNASPKKIKKGRNANLVWKWIRQCPGMPPVGRWMAEDESIQSSLLHYEGIHRHDVYERWAANSKERTRISRERRRERMGSPIDIHHHMSQVLMEHAGPSTEEYHQEQSDAESVNVVNGGADALPISSFSSNQEWTGLYDDAPPPLHPPEVFDEKHPSFDSVAVAALNRSRRAALRLTKMEKQQEDERRRHEMKEEREARLMKEAMEMVEEKKRRKAVDEGMKWKRARRAEYVRRRRAEKRMSMGEGEWEKHLERERDKRKEREKRKLATPGYLEKKRMRQTLKTRELRANLSLSEGRNVYYGGCREEEVYEDGVYEMEETHEKQNKDDHSPPKNGGLKQAEDEEVEVEKW
ncbi:hypothetical protein PMAYCL1PPCAC_06759, partial [Pristionchus mayeri]